MAKDYNIKWTRSDYGKLSQAISQFNKNIKKLEAVESELILPDVVNYKDLKSGITTRQELNRMIGSLRRFTNPAKQKAIKLDSGIEITAWEYTELKAERRRAEKRLTGELFGLEATLGTGNKRINEIRGTIASLQKLETATGEDFKRIRKRIKVQGTSDFNRKKAKTFQDNFIKAFKGMGRKEIVEYAQKFKDPEEFWNAIKDSGFSNLQEFYDESEGILRFSMDSDERYFYELEQLGL
mgnify:CR=1 FL=1